MGKRENQKGLSLIELTIALAILGLLAVATITFDQLFVLPPRNETHMVVIRQVQNAGYWLSRDGTMAQEVKVNPPSGFPLTFRWEEWDTKHKITVTYVLTDKILTRQKTVGATTTRAEIARYITEAKAIYDQGQKLLTVTLTASRTDRIGTISETRTYTIKPRPAPRDEPLEPEPPGPGPVPRPD